MDEYKVLIMQAMAALLQQWCVGDAASITIHADVTDGLPYQYVRVWGADPDAERLLYEWTEFPEGVGE